MLAGFPQKGTPPAKCFNLREVIRDGISGTTRYLKNLRTRTRVRVRAKTRYCGSALQQQMVLALTLVLVLRFFNYRVVPDIPSLISSLEEALMAQGKQL